MKKETLLIHLLWMISQVGLCQIQIISDWDTKSLAWTFPNGLTTKSNTTFNNYNKSKNVGSFTTSSNEYDIIYHDFPNTISFSDHNTYSFKVYSPVAGKVLLKFENKENTLSTSIEKNITQTNTWQTLVFDLSNAPSNTYTRLVIFFDYQGNSVNQEWLIDDLIAYKQNPNTLINIFPNQVIQSNYLGNGVQWEPYPSVDISESDWTRVFERVDYLKLTFIRLIVPAQHYCTAYPVGGAPTYTFQSIHMQRLYKLLDYCESKGVKVILGDWAPPISALNIKETDVRWVKMVADLLNHLWNTKKYTCIKYYNLGNEPNGSWMPYESFDTWKASIVNLSNELKQRGVRDKIRIVGPDCAWADNWISRCIQDKDLVAAIDDYEVHRYADTSEITSSSYFKDMNYYRNYITKNAPNGSEKSFFMGEIGYNTWKSPFDQQTQIRNFNYGIWMTSAAIQSMKAGQSGLIAWNLDDAIHAFDWNGYPNLNAMKWKEWGFWDSLAEEKGKPSDANIRPWFYTWSLLSRLIPPGSETLLASETNIKGLSCVSTRFKSNNAYHMTIVISNQSTSHQSFNISTPGITSPATFDQYRYIENNSPVNAKGFPVVSSTVVVSNLQHGIPISIPANSVIILSTLDNHLPINLSTSVISSSQSGMNSTNQITVFPTPASGKLFYTLSKAEKHHLRIFDMQGNEVLNEVRDHVNHIDISNLESGVYMLELNQGEYQSVSRFYVE